MEYGNGLNNELIWKSSDNRYHDKDIEAVKADNRNVNIAVLGNMVEDGSNILDIGCGEGKFGSILRNRKCNVYGVDIDSAALDYAKNNYDYRDVFCFNLENCDGNAEAERLEQLNISFDYIALLDVLEHVINPTQVLLNALRFLKDGGKLLLSVPNVNNGDIFLNLLRDHFYYRQEGVLDNTHVKFFTKSSFVNWIGEINKEYSFSMDCRYIGSIYGDTDFMKEAEKKYPNVCHFIQQNPYYRVIQHLYVLDYYADKHDTPELDESAAEEIDLIPMLEKALSCSEYAAGLKPALSENEREVMEQQIDAANKGWKEAAGALEAADKFISQCEANITDLQAYARKLEKDVEEVQAYARQLEKERNENNSGLLQRIRKKLH